ncbi:MAG: aminotransferase class IV [bacterium]|nr:aminotransferase class IV [bacterium]
MVKYCYHNGKIISTDKAGFSVQDIGILRGYGIFDFATTYNGKPFLLKEHCLRLRKSAKLMKLSVPLSDAQIEKIVAELLQKNKLKDANIRILITGGKTVDGLSYEQKNNTCTILLHEKKLLSEDVYTKGATLMVHEHLRPFYESKTTNYITAVHLQEKLKKVGAIEILYTFKEKVLECSTANFFIFKGDTLITPKDMVLIGITRNLVLKLAKKAGFLIEERDIAEHELQEATEAFITSTNKEVLPIVKVGSQKIGDGKVGKNSKELRELFTAEIAKL